VDASELARRFEEEALPRIRRMVSETERFLYLIAWLNTTLEREGLGRVVIVGGFAVEVLTGSTYRTFDVDIVVEGGGARELVEGFLAEISKPRRGRVFLPRLRALASKGIDIVGTSYDRPKPPIRVRVDGLRAYVEACEELILTYLSAWKFWESLEDRDKVYALVAVHWGRIDRSYVVERAREEGVHDLLVKVLRDLSYG